MSLTGNLVSNPRDIAVLAWNLANPSGAAGATVSVAVTAADSTLPPSGLYFVDVELPGDYTSYITAKSSAGFTVNIQPRLAANSVAAGTFNAKASW